MRPIHTIFTFSSDLLMRKDNMIDEQKEDEEQVGEGRRRHKKTVARGRNGNVCELCAKNRKLRIAFIF